MKGRVTTFLFLVFLCLADTAFAFDAAASLIISGASTEIAGTSDDLTITAVDNTGFTDAGYEGVKSLVFSGALPSTNPVHNPTVSDHTGAPRNFGTPTDISFKKGIASVTGESGNGQMFIYLAGPVTISATDGTISSAGKGDLNVTVTPGALSGFDVAAATPQQVGKAFTGTNTITAHDAYGNVITDFDASKDNVTVTSTLQGTLTGLGSSGNNILNRGTDFSSGISSLSSNLVYRGASGSGTLLAMASSGKSGTSNSFVMAPGDAAQMAFVQQPTNTLVGAVITPAVTVQVQDASGNNVAQSGITVVLGLTSGTGTLGGTVQRATDATGLATFADLTIDQTGTKQLTASSAGLTSAVSQTFGVTAGPASKIVLQTQPSSSATAGVAFGQQPVLAVEDAAGNVVTTDNSTVVTASVAGNTLQGTPSVKAINGIITFTDLALTKAGSFPLQFNSQPALTGATSNAIAVSPAAASKLLFTQQPTTAGVGAIISPPVAVQLRDAFDNNVATAGIGVTMALSSGTGTLAGTLTQSTDASGTATFSDLSINASGAKTLTASGSGLASAVSASFTIGIPSKLVIQTAPPAAAIAGAVFNPQPVIAIADAAGNVITTDNSTVVTVKESAGGPGGLQGTLSVTAVNGLASFANLTETKAGTVSLQFTSQPALTPVSSSNISVSAAAAAKLTYSQQPTDAAAGSVIKPPITVQLMDAYNNNVAKAGVPVTMSLSSGTGSLSGTTTRDSNGSGLASFNDLSINAPGQKVLLASSSNLTSALSSGFTIAPAQATQLTFAQQPSGVQAGQIISPAIAVQLLDGTGNPVTDSGIAVTVSLSSGTGTLSGTLTRTTTNGVATFDDLSMQIAGQKTLTMSSSGLTPATSQSFTISPAAAAQTTFVQEPATTKADTVIIPPVTVQLRDAYGNAVTTAGIPVTMSLSSGTGVLTGTLTRNTDASGLASFNDLNVNLVGDKILAASSSGLTASVSSTFTIIAGDPKELAFVQQPTDAPVGQTIAPPVTVKAKDNKGNDSNVSGIAITLSISSGTGTLHGTVTRSTVNGVATFDDLNIDQPGDKVLTASAQGLKSANSNKFKITGSAAAAQLVIQTQPSATATAGAAFSRQPVIAIEDAFGNIVTTDNTTTVTASVIGTTLQGTVTVKAVNGIVTFPDLALTKTGTYQLQFASQPVLTGVTSNSVTVNPAPASALIFVQQPTTAAVGATITPPVTVQLKDAFGNDVKSNGVAVTMALGGSGTLGGTLTQNTTNGLATFSDLNVSQNGSKTLTASSSGLTSATSQAFDVTGGTASQLVIQRQPSSSSIAGAVFSRQPVIAITDASGNVVTSDNSTVVTVQEGAGGPGGLQGTKSVTAVNGVAAFTDLSETKAGTISLQFTSQPTLTSVTSNPISVTAAAAAKLVYIQQPTDAAAGATITPAVTVQLRDAYDNDVARSGVAVTVRLTSGTGNLTGTTTRNTSSAGLATFSNLKINAPGDKILTASTNGLTPAVSNPFTIGAGAPTQVAFVQQPSAAAAGAVITPAVTVQLRDASGNDVTTSGAIVTISLNGTGTLGGTLTQSTSNGLATFGDLTIDQVGSKQLVAASAGLASATSQSFAITAAQPSKLAFVQQPMNVGAGASITPPVTVQLLDAFNNRVNTGGIPVTVSLNSGGGTLSGTLTRSTDASGLATFNDLQVSTTGQKTLAASSPNLQSVTSQTFTVLAGAANQLAFVQQPGNTTAGTVFSPAITVRIIDGNGNTNPVSGTPITLSVTTGDTLFGTTTKNTVDGVATFDDISLRAAGQKTLVAASPGLPAISSNTFTVAAGPPVKVAVETAANGAGTIVGAQSIASGSAITAYAITRDAYNNFVANAAAGSWVLQNVTGGVGGSDLTPSADKKNARFTGKAAGSAVIVASVSGLASEPSGVITVIAGSQYAKVLVETAADGTGAVLGDRTLVAGAKLTVYAIARDSANNFVRNVVAEQWNIQNATGGIVQQDLTPSADKKNATFTAHKTGQARLQASAGGITGTPSGVVTVVAGTAAKLEVAGGTSQEAQVNTEFPQRLVVKVTDTYGNPVGGITVTFSSPANGPGGSFSGGNNTAISDAAGVATSSAFLANSYSGVFTVTASAPGVTTPVTFTLTNKAGSGANIAVVEGTSQSAAVGTAFATRFKVTVKDDAGNAIGGALVHFSAPASGASGNFPGGLVDSARTTASGEATSSVFTANFVAGAYSIIASTESGKTVTINLTNTPGALTRFAVESDKGGKIDTQFVGVRFGIRIRALDAYDNAVTSFSDGIVISSTGDLSLGAGVTPPFSSGVLPSYAVGFSKTGTFTIVATRSGGGASGTSNAFLVGNPRPVVRRVSPSSGLAGQTIVANVSGRGFLDGVTTVTFGDGIGTSTVINSDTMMTVTLQIDQSANSGPRDVTVINTPPVGGAAFLANGFTIGNHPKPTVSSIQPSSGAQLQSLTLMVRGTNFLGNDFSHLFFTGDGITIDSASVDSSTVIHAGITISATATPGPRDVVIVNDGPGGGTDTLYRAFAVTPGVLATPVLLQPPNGSQGQPPTFTLSWQASPGAAGYQIQVASDAAFTSMVMFDSTGSTSYQIGPLPSHGVFHWRVRAVSGGGMSGWSSAWSFDNLPTAAQTISLNNVVDFPDHAKPSEYTSYDYRIVGLPGASNSRLNNFIPGAPDVDWRVFWDNGGAADYLVSFDGSSTFTFAPGRAFWMLKKGPWAVSVTIAAAQIDSATHAVLVSLHSGWNLITNPMVWPIPWDNVKAANGATEPIYRFDGLYNRADSFDPYIGYYFFNDPQNPLEVLKVPYGPGLGKGIAHKTSSVDSTGSWTIHVDLRSGKYVDQSTSLGVNLLASEGKDKLDYHKPRAFGDMPSIYFSHPEWDSLYSIFANDIHPPFGDKSSWKFVVSSKGPKGGDLELDFRGLETAPAGMEVYLIDEAAASYHDLKQEGAVYRFTPASPTTNFTLLVGKKEALADQLGAVVPRTFALDQNYPNPFNPSTAIPVSLPVRANVELKIYNVLGQEVKTLQSGPLEAGRHVFVWDGTNTLGTAVASGMYISRLTSDTGVKLGRKMLLVR